MTLPSVRLKVKLPLLFIAIALLPLVAITIIWFSFFQKEFTVIANREIAEISEHTEIHIDNYIGTKILSLIIHSQTQAIIKADYIEAKSELSNLLLQDEDIMEVRLLNTNGQEAVRLNRDKIYADSELRDQSKTPAYKLTTFLGGEKYVGPVTLDANGKSTTEIAVPVVLPELAQSLQEINTSSIGKVRQKGEILGILIIKINLENLLTYVEDLRVGKSGYVFVVDKYGTVIMHPDKKLVAQRKNMTNLDPVKKFVETYQLNKTHATFPVKSKNDKNEDSLILSSHLVNADWGIIAVKPLVEISNQIASTASVTAALFLGTFIIVTLISLSVASRITKPIEKLRIGSRYFGKGNLDYQLSVTRGDEIGDLASSFNTMASQLKHDRNSLITEKDTLATVLGNIADGVIALNEKYEILLINNSALSITELSSVAVIGKKIDSALSIKDERTTFEKLCKDSGTDLNSQIVPIITMVNVQKTIQVIVAKLDSSILSDIKYIITFYDVSKAQELEAMKIDFVSMAAHELRTPLTAIRGYTLMLDEELGKQLNQEQDQYVKRIITSVANLSALVDNLLNASRIEKGTLKLDFRPSSIEDLAKTTVQNLQQVAKNKNQTLAWVEPPETLPQVSIDKFRIEEVLTNLVANAINYTSEKGKITVTAEKKDKEIYVSVTDTGEGIPKDAIPKLFTKFFRVGGKLEQGSKGTGLGLFISKEILTLHNGKVWVESVLGQGSTFTFSLPISDQVGLQKNENSTSAIASKGFILNPARNKQVN